MSSIRDVARLAGVSPATVSRVINGTANVSPERRDQVLRAISQTGFVPNEVARSLFKKSSKSIGLIIPNIRNPFFTQLAQVVDAVARQYGHHFLLCNVGTDLDEERTALQMLAALNTDGVVIASSNEEIEADLSRYKMPIVVIDALFETPDVNAYIYCDFYRGGQLAAQHLTECGCRSIVCIRGPQNLYSARARYQGYRDFCRAHGIQERVADCEYDFYSGLEAAERLLDRYPNTDGIIACNDLVAISIYKILHKRRISVPKQIQLIGFDDIALASVVSPELTTIHQPIREMGIQATKLILEPPIPPKSGQQHILPVSLVPRETTCWKKDA